MEFVYSGVIEMNEFCFSCELFSTIFFAQDLQHKVLCLKWKANSVRKIRNCVLSSVASLLALNTNAFRLVLSGRIALAHFK